MIPSYLKKALAACEIALEKQSEWENVSQTLGNILQSMAWFEEAAFWQSQAMNSKLNLGEAYASLGRIYAHYEMIEEAKSAFEKAIELKPKLAEVHWYLAQIYEYLGHKEKEIDSWVKVFRLKPEKATAVRLYKLGKDFQERGEVENALACYRRVLNEKGRFLPAYYDVGEIFTDRGNREKALKCYERIIEIDPSQALAHHKLGSILLEEKKYEEAIAAFRESIKLEKKQPWAYRALIKTLIQMEKWDEAIAACQGVISLVEEYPWVYIQLARASLIKGEREQAEVAIQKANYLMGWGQIIDKDYRFTQDTLSNQIPVWKEHLQGLAHQPIQALEIGTEQGMAACWLLDNILTHPEAKLTCIDPKFKKEFEVNIAKTGAAEKVRKIEGDMDKILESLEGNTYDFISISSKITLTTNIEEKANIAWGKLKVGGMIILDNHKYLRKQRGIGEKIDNFLAIVEKQGEIVNQQQQIIVKKITA